MSNAQEKKIENVSIAKFALFGAAGFGIGGLTEFLIMELAGENLLFFMLAFPIPGALGGAALGLALRRKVTTLALLGAIGFLVGALIGFFIGEELGGENLGLAGFLFSAVRGMIGGAALGLALRNWRAIIGLTLAGAIGFGIGWTIFSATPLDPPWLGWVLMGIIGGAFLGAALGYLEKEKL